MVKTQEQTIKDIEQGKFSNGIRSVNIPKKDKPTNPERDTFPFVFKSLEKTQTLMKPSNDAQSLKYSQQKQETFATLNTMDKSKSNISPYKKQPDSKLSGVLPVNYEDF